MKVKAKFENIRDKIDGNEVDLSLCNLTEVPVRELAAFPKATSLDLSCNNLITLAPEFCSLVHLTRIDLSKNQLYSLPEDMGQLTSLQHLDLFQNKLITLPVSFSQLRSLRWLDLKDNPLEAPLAKVAGDCLDDKQCRQCANMVLQHMRVLQEEADKLTEKRLLRQRELELKREAKLREQEAREKEVRKKEKAEEKERKRREYEAQQAALAQQETQRKRREERKERRAAANAEKKKAESAVAVRSGWSVWRLLLRLFLLLLLGACVSVCVCHVTALRDEPVCVPLRTLLQDAVQWAEGQELLQPIMQKISPGHTHSS
ncbi:leucine-rich repeat-containing protein 59 [Engraulis encrasicolus]|uniref:leucine-rich repeat-containing protein 59 n=1 Tax=Engraulis encrasicolus TaxID=184585 RepID=UPI002FD350A8